MATDKAVNLKVLEVTEKLTSALAEINAKLDRILASLPESKMEQTAKVVERRSRQ